jgi:hypothetical protein
VSRPADIQALGRCGDAQAATEHDVIVGGLREVERNLWVLMMGVPPLRRRDVPLHFQ